MGRIIKDTKPMKNFCMKLFIFVVLPAVLTFGVVRRAVSVPTPIRTDVCSLSASALGVTLNYTNGIAFFSWDVTCSSGGCTSCQAQVTMELVKWVPRYNEWVLVNTANNSRYFLCGTSVPNYNTNISFDGYSGGLFALYGYLYDGDGNLLTYYVEDINL